MSAEERELEMARVLGRLEAQVRELIHDGNARAQRNIAVDQILGELKGLPEQLAAMDTRIDLRLTSLEHASIARSSREGVLAALARSPFVAWVLLGGGIIWAAIKGKINLDG